TYTVRDNLLMVSNMMIYLDKSVYGNMGNVFNNRIANKVDKPEIVFTLSDKEKFPEIFMNLAVSDTSQEFFKNTIEKVKAKYVTYLASGIYNILNPTKKRYSANLPQQLGTELVDINPYYGKCTNESNLPEWDIVRYNYNGNLYCFSITDLVTQFDTGNYINEYTGKKFDQTFIDDFIQTFRKTPIEIPVSLSDKDTEDIETS